MDKIDRLGWAAGINFVSYGLRIGVRVSDAAILNMVEEYLPPDWKPAPSAVVDRVYSIIVGGEGSRPGIRRYNLAYANATRIARTPELFQALDAFESDLQLYVAETAPRRVFVHAGVVRWRGKAIIIPGRSFSGKTTLTAELVKAGATYYSDEYAVLDGQGRVHPYRRRLSVRENGHLERPKKYAVESLGGRSGIKPLQVGLVIVSKYKPNARWRPQKVSAGEGALALMANTVSVRRQPETTLATLRKVVARAPVFKGTRGEARQVIDFIFEQLGD
ncbi:MAG TPA: hypothetical protein VFO63_19705 [Blastocatellia bacterium]|nr:hypothetical protein [Blastocatellia bacterium]